MAKAKEIREQSNEELTAQLNDLRKNIFEMRNALSSKREDVKPYQIKMKKKDIARILTLLRQRELEQTA